MSNDSYTTNVVAFNPRLGTKTDAPPLPKAGGGGTSDGMDPNIQRLDDKIDNRFFWLLGIFGAGFVLLAGLIINSTNRLSDRIDNVTLTLGAKIDGVSDQVDQVGQRVAKLEGASEAKPPPVTAPRR